jgi:hypothetical protein
VLARAQDQGWDGIRVESTALSPSDRRQFEAAVGQVERRLREQGRRFLLATGEHSMAPPPRQVYANR